MSFCACNAIPAFYFHFLFVSLVKQIEISVITAMLA